MTMKLKQRELWLEENEEQVKVESWKLASP
jgi:hypothetical protein